METPRTEDVWVRVSPAEAHNILGLFALSAILFLVCAPAGWSGPSLQSHVYVLPIVLFGGLIQMISGIWSLRSRDSLAAVVHGMWGFFWLSYGILSVFFATNMLPMNPGAYSTSLGYWSIPLAIATWAGAAAASRSNMALFAFLTILGLGATVSVVGFLAGSGIIVQAAGWILVAASIAGWYTATAMLLEWAFDYSVLPIGRRRVVHAEVHADTEAPVIERP
ncbi:MAG: GPR1/FUN34/YaaH family transporter [bacterium]